MASFCTRLYGGVDIRDFHIAVAPEEAWWTAMITVARFILTLTLWLLLLPFWPLWLLFSESCDWMDRRGQRRYRAAVSSTHRGDGK
jgi:hypothetical protein